MHKIAPVKQNNKTVNLSTRIDKIIYDQLVEDAAKKGISLNSLMNSIAKHHITWKRYADEIGFVPITKRMLGKIFKYLDKESIEKMAKELGGTVPKELLYLTYDKMNFENFVQILEINALRFGVVHHKENDGKPWEMPIQLLLVFIGCIVVYSSLFSIGSFLYGNILTGVALLLAAIVGTIFLFKSFGKLRAN